MQRTYYYIEVNDGVKWSTDLKTLKQAKKELKDIILDDKQELGCGVGTYRIVKCVETDTVISESIICEVEEN